MLRSWRLGTIAGIGVNVHSTFLLLLGFIALSQLLASGAEAAVIELVSVGVLFGIVVLHELGHALAARRFGIATRSITLYPIGGVARLERMPERPIQEILVAGAGPAVNVALAASAYGLGTLAGVGSFSWIVSRFVLINVVLAVFNLLPAFPMDGGRVLRALLALRSDYVAATRRAAAVGRVLAVALGILGLFFNPMLILIAVFIWMAGRAEEQSVYLRHAARQTPFFWFVNTPREQWWRMGRGTREPHYTIVDD
jgi:Zn-dependent protease